MPDLSYVGTENVLLTFLLEVFLPGHSVNFQMPSCFGSVCSRDPFVDINEEREKYSSFFKSRGHCRSIQ